MIYQGLLVIYKVFTSCMIRCLLQPPTEMSDLVDVEQYLEAMANVPNVRIRVSYHTSTGMLIGTGVIHYVRLQGIKAISDQSTVLPGICCECCHDMSWTKVFGEFPKHGTASQFFTPRVFDAYTNAGKDAIGQAVRDLMHGIENDNQDVTQQSFSAMNEPIATLV